jgi:hypothetical protein
MSGRLAWIALFLSLAGTAVAARPLLSGRDVADDSLTGRDVRDHTLRRRHMRMESLRGPTGPQGPQGPAGPPTQPGPPDADYLFAYVNADGSVRTSRSIAVTSPSGGVYCVRITYGPSSPRWVHAESSDVETARRASAHVYDDGEPHAPCPAEATVRVDVSPGPGPFLIVLGTG